MAMIVAPHEAIAVEDDFVRYLSEQGVGIRARSQNVVALFATRIAGFQGLAALG